MLSMNNGPDQSLCLHCCYTCPISGIAPSVLRQLIAAKICVSPTTLHLILFYARLPPPPPLYHSFLPPHTAKIFRQKKARSP